MWGGLTIYKTPPILKESMIALIQEITINEKERHLLKVRARPLFRGQEIV
jgi:hypothetical protein